MPNVVFAAPFLMDTTLRFVRAAADLPGVRVALLSQDPEQRVPQDLRGKIAGHYRLENGLDGQQIADGVRAAAKALGRVDRLLGTLEQLQVPLAEVRQALGLAGMGVQAAQNFRDKARMKDVLRSSGLPCARHALATSTAEAERKASDLRFPLVCKPPAGAAAKATFRVETMAQLSQSLRAYRPSPASPILMEEFLSGAEHSLDTVSIDGRPVWHSISRYFPTPLEVLENSWIQWCVVIPREVDHAAFHPIRKAGFAALDALGMKTGVTHMEWFRRPDGGVAISEVAARPPGAQFCSLISYATDRDFYRAWARLMVFEQFEPPERKYAVGAAYLRGQGEGRVRDIRGLEQAQQELGELVVEAKLPQQGQGPSGSYEGEGYVILRHPDTGTVERATRRVVELVQVSMG